MAQHGEHHGDQREEVLVEEVASTGIVKSVGSGIANILKATPTMLPAVLYAGLRAPYGPPDTTQYVLMMAGTLAELFKSYKAVDDSTLHRVTGWTLEACNALLAFWLTIQNFESTAMRFALASAIINLVTRGVTREEVLKRDIGHS